MSDDSIPQKEKEKILVFQYSDELSEYQELELDEDIALHELLDSDFILLFVDPKRYRVWIWQGTNVTTRMKFVSARIAPRIKDQYGIGLRILSVDEGNETAGFKAMIGLEEEVDYSETQTGPVYEGTQEDLELFESMSREKILLLLEKSGVPEGYERKMVIVKNKIFGYKEYDKNYLGSVIREKQLFPLKEEVEDGPYLAENYIPRMLFSYNKVVLTELFQKIDGKKGKEDEEIEN